MKYLLPATLTIFVLLYINSYMLHDNNLFVPCPENVTKDFLKKVEDNSFNVAMKDLSETSPYKRNLNLLKLQKRIESTLGKYEVARGKSHFVSDSVALSNVSLEGISKKMWPVFLLRKENGLWKIEKLVGGLSN